MAQSLYRVCRDLSLWGKKCGLAFNASKTVVTCIHYSQKTTLRKTYVQNLVQMDGIKTPFLLGQIPRSDPR